MQVTKAFVAEWMNCLGNVQQMMDEYEQLKQRVAALESENAALTETLEQWKNNDEFYRKLDEYLVQIDACKGRFVIHPLNKLTDRLAQDMASMADLADDDVLWDVSKRALVSAWKAGCILWVLNNQTWSKAIGEIVEWLVYHDIWSKMQLFADMLSFDVDLTSEAQRHGPKNMLGNLPNSFNEAQLEALRTSLGKSVEGTKNQLYKWVFRKFITYSAETGLYTKTDEYLKR